MEVEIIEKSTIRRDAWEVRGKAKVPPDGVILGVYNIEHDNKFVHAIEFGVGDDRRKITGTQLKAILDILKKGEYRLERFDRHKKRED